MNCIGDMTDDELNAAAAVEVMGWSHDATGIGSFFVPGHGHIHDADWSPATDIAAAFKVIERMREKFWLDISTPHQWREWYEVEVHKWNAYDHQAKVKSESLPRAICEAALQAVRASK